MTDGMRRAGIALAMIIATSGSTLAVEGPTAEEIRRGVERGLERVRAAAENYPNYRDCFSCHHQTLPLMAMVSADRAGVDVDRKLLEEIVSFSAESFETRSEQLEEGAGIGGSSMTVGYGLWTFIEAGRKPDALSEAMVGFLLKNQEKSGRWRTGNNRPPMEVSHVMCTTLASYGIREYAPRIYRSFALKAEERAREWLAEVEPTQQEDRAAKLWGLWLLGFDEEAIAKARKAVLDAQREDGGWAQLDDMESDAYATGQALTLLARTGFPTDDPSYRRGLSYLIATQCEDGSWKVETRSRPVQTFFDNGDPHGKSMFISTAATSWAVTALAEALATQAPTDGENQ